MRASDLHEEYRYSYSTVIRLVSGSGTPVNRGERAQMQWDHWMPFIDYNLLGYVIIVSTLLPIPAVVEVSMLRKFVDNPC